MCLHPLAEVMLRPYSAFNYHFQSTFHPFNPKLTIETPSALVGESQAVLTRLQTSTSQPLAPRRHRSRRDVVYRALLDVTSEP